jgi:hypothetical protein
MGSSNWRTQQSLQSRSFRRSRTFTGCARPPVPRGKARSLSNRSISPRTRLRPGLDRRSRADSLTARTTFSMSDRAFHQSHYDPAVCRSNRDGQEFGRVEGRETYRLRLSPNGHHASSLGQIRLGTYDLEIDLARGVETRDLIPPVSSPARGFRVEPGSSTGPNAGRRHSTGTLQPGPIKSCSQTVRCRCRWISQPTDRSSHSAR